MWPSVEMGLTHLRSVHGTWGFCVRCCLRIAFQPVFRVGSVRS